MRQGLNRQLAPLVGLALPPFPQNQVMRLRLSLDQYHTEKRLHNIQRKIARDRVLSNQQSPNSVASCALMLEEVWSHEPRHRLPFHLNLSQILELSTLLKQSPVLHPQES